MLKPMFGIGDRFLNLIQACAFDSEAEALEFFARGVREDALKYASDDSELLYVGEFDTVTHRVIRKPMRVIAKAQDVLGPKH